MKTIVLALGLSGFGLTGFAQGDIGSTLSPDLNKNKVKVAKSRICYKAEDQPEYTCSYSFIYLFSLDKVKAQDIKKRDSLTSARYVFYNKAGQLITDSSVWDGGGGSPYVQKFTYDKLGRVIENHTPSKDTSFKMTYRPLEYKNDSVYCYITDLEKTRKGFLFVMTENEKKNPLNLFSISPNGKRSLYSSNQYDKNGYLTEEVFYVVPTGAVWQTYKYTNNKKGLRLKVECIEQPGDREVLTIEYEYEYYK